MVQRPAQISPLKPLPPFSEHGRDAPVIFHQRTDYAASMIDGRTVMETSPSGRSAREVAELWKYVNTQPRKQSAA